ncbi:MAG: CoA pyrophosphatase [Bacteroidia bacterium]|nr:CoA pyrophosphatase [Bacteroidia bacterium]
MNESQPFIHKLKQRLSQPLPGLDAQMTMSPSLRGRNPVIPENVRKSAVLVLVYPQNGSLYVPFMRRAEDGRVHSGQISFPGGKWDDTDTDFIDTALREANEEMGIRREEVEVLGQMTELYIPPSNFLVYPTVGFSPRRPDFIPDPKEVADIVEVEIAHLADKNIRGSHRVEVFGGNYITAPGFTVNGDRLIWGATAMMLAEFLEILNDLK